MNMKYQTLPELADAFDRLPFDGAKSRIETKGDLVGVITAHARENEVNDEIDSPLGLQFDISMETESQLIVECDDSDVPSEEDQRILDEGNAVIEILERNNSGNEGDV